MANLSCGSFELNIVVVWLIDVVHLAHSLCQLTFIEDNLQSVYNSSAIYLPKTDLIVCVITSMVCKRLPSRFCSFVKHCGHCAMLGVHASSKVQLSCISCIKLVNY